MFERFIERGTTFPLMHGKLSIYETNCSCDDVKFYFDQYVITLMLSGHKTIISDNLKFEFFPGTLFIPEKATINKVSIPQASIENPTQCLVLELEPDFIESFYLETAATELGKKLLYAGPISAAENYFLSNNTLLIKAFKYLYEIQQQDVSQSKPLVENLVLKEILLRIFQTEGLYLLRDNFNQSVYNKDIKEVISFITKNIDKNITTTQLADIAKMGNTTFFGKFKEATGQTPIDYVLNERIKHAKILIQKNKWSLQEIAHRSGFNSYEYFCSTFKKIEKMKPSGFKKSKLAQIVA